MGYSVSGTAAGEARPAAQPPGRVRLAGMLTLSWLVSPTGQATVTFVGELDAASADQAYGDVRLVAPPPLLRKIIRITGLADQLPVPRADQAGHVQVA